MSGWMDEWMSGCMSGWMEKNARHTQNRDKSITDYFVKLKWLSTTFIP